MSNSPQGMIPVTPSDRTAQQPIQPQSVSPTLAQSQAPVQLASSDETVQQPKPYVSIWERLRPSPDQPAQQPSHYESIFARYRQTPAPASALSNSPMGVQLERHESEGPVTPDHKRNRQETKASLASKKRKT